MVSREDYAPCFWPYPRALKFDFRLLNTNFIMTLLITRIFFNSILIFQNKICREKSPVFPWIVRKVDYPQKLQTPSPVSKSPSFFREHTCTSLTGLTLKWRLLQQDIRMCNTSIKTFYYRLDRKWGEGGKQRSTLKVSNLFFPHKWLDANITWLTVVCLYPLLFLQDMKSVGDGEKVNEDCFAVV